MADTKITALTAYSAEAGDDVLAIVDVSDTSMAASGTDKACTVYQLFGSPSGTGQLLWWNGTGTGVPGGAANLKVGASGNLNLNAQAAPGTPTTGDLWYDSTQHGLVQSQEGMSANLLGLLFVQTTSVTVATTGAQTLVSTTGAVGTRTIPANWWVVGRTIRLRMGGYFTTPASSQGTVTMGLRFAAAQWATAMGQSWSASITNRMWEAEVLITCKAVGASGKFDAIGHISQHGATAGMINNATMATVTNGSALGTQAANTQITMDTTASMTLDWQVSESAASCSVTQTMLTIEALA